MSVFRCGRFPDGEVPIRTAAGLVVFHDGQAVVDDPELAQALREVPPSFEITEDGGESRSAAPSGSPRKRTPKKEA